MDGEVVVDHARLEALAAGWRQTAVEVRGTARALVERDAGWCEHVGPAVAAFTDAWSGALGQLADHATTVQHELVSTSAAYLAVDAQAAATCLTRTPR